MKKWLLVTGLILSILVLTACGSSGQSTQQAEETPPSPPDLTGEWTQTNSNSEDAWQMAIITDTDITVYWVMDNGDTKSLYWAGTFVPPTDTTEPYTWDSQNDTEQTGMAILASGDDTKAFTYSDGVISYEVSALGTTTTVRLSKS